MKPYEQANVAHLGVYKLYLSARKRLIREYKNGLVGKPRMDLLKEAHVLAQQLDAKPVGLLALELRTKWELLQEVLNG